MLDNMFPSHPKDPQTRSTVLQHTTISDPKHPLAIPRPRFLPHKQPLNDSQKGQHTNGKDKRKVLQCCAGIAPNLVLLFHPTGRIRQIILLNPTLRAPTQRKKEKKRNCETSKNPVYSGDECWMLVEQTFCNQQRKEKEKDPKTEARHSRDSASTLLPRQRVEVHVWPQWTHHWAHRVHVRVDSLQSLEVADCSYLG